MSTNTEGPTIPPKKKARILSSDDATFSDLTLKFGDEIRKVHKAIICRKSGWFATALTSDFMEAKQNSITLQDDDPETLNAVLDFCYGDNLETACASHVGIITAKFCANLYETADKYDVAALISDIESWFRANSLANVPKEDRYEALGVMYRMPDPAALPLRVIALKGLHCQLSEMNSEKAFQDLIEEQPQLAADVLRLLGEGFAAGRLHDRWKCLACRECFFLIPDKELLVRAPTRPTNRPPTRYGRNRDDPTRYPFCTCHSITIDASGVADCSTLA